MMRGVRSKFFFKMATKIDKTLVTLKINQISFHNWPLYVYNLLSYVITINFKI